MTRILNHYYQKKIVAVVKLTTSVDILEINRISKDILLDMEHIMVVTKTPAV